MCWVYRSEGRYLFGVSLWVGYWVYVFVLEFSLVGFLYVE